jgi:hypothetical protein
MSITGSLASCMMFIFDVGLWQESDSCAHVRERWLIFEADAAAFYVARRSGSSEACPGSQKSWEWIKLFRA